LLLGPGVLKMMPKELTESFYDQTWDCDVFHGKHQQKITNEGTHYCDLEAYVAAKKYDDYWGLVTSVKYTDYLKTHGRKGRRLAGKSQKGKADAVSYGKCVLDACTLKKAISTATIPDIFTLTGHIGVGMMIFESGMHFDFQQAKTVGPWACLVAVLGTFLPIVSGTGLSLLFGFDMMGAMSVGVSLAPTSVGIALKLLHEADALKEYFGQAVMTAAFVDDVLSLVIFSVLFTLGGGDASFMDFIPLIVGCIFMAIAIPAAVVFWPPFLDFVFRKIPENRPDAKLTDHHKVMFIILFVTLIAYGQITFMCGTHLWGCFIAGMSFATRHEAHHVWVRQVKRNTCWFLRIFFACTLAWSIPVKSLFSLSAFWKGSLMGIGPCIACKVLCGPFMGDSRWVIGWAMVGRAEFAYFIAILARSMKMMDEDLFAILIWALLYATVFAPLIFRKVLARYMRKLGNVEAAEKVEHANLEHDGDHFEDDVAIEEFNVIKEIKRKQSENDDTLSRVNSTLSEKDCELGERIMEITKLKAHIKRLEAIASTIPEEVAITTEPDGPGVTTI